MKLRGSILIIISLFCLFVFVSCSGNNRVDPIRPAASINLTDDVDTILLSKSNGNVEIASSKISHSLVFEWINDGLSVTNNGNTIYDLTLSNEKENYSFGIVEKSMTTAPLGISFESDINKLGISFSEVPNIEINNHIYHNDGYDIDHAVFTGENDGYVDNEILFGFIENTPDSERHRIIREHNIFLTGINTSIGMHTGRIDDGRFPYDVVTELANETSIRWPEVNGLANATSWPNDYVWKETWPDTYRWALQRIQAREAWDVYKDGVLDNAGDGLVRNIVMAIADTGVYPHDDFGIDTFDYWVARTYSKNFISPGAPPLDNYGHGTSVAGIAGALGNNITGGTGVCWDPYFLSLKCLSDYGSGGWDIIGNSIAYVGNLAVIAPWMKIIANYSLGGWSDNAWERQAAGIANAFPNTMLLGAAGNNGGEYANTFFPAALPDFMSIAASSIQTQDGKCKEVYNECPYGWGTNWGTVVDVCAPGSSYVTTTNIPWNTMYGSPDANCPFSCSNWYCDHFGGTSAATPHVSGLVALLWSKWPELTKEEIKARIVATADEMSIPSDKIGKLGGGRINCYRALTDPW
ncbi:S8 family serine peptidase [bacterium]|nr:S8 family serine peptidase [bacterium]MBU1025285.1 S8 family serine peptidase [bacterium]